MADEGGDDDSVRPRDDRTDAQRRRDDLVDEGVLVSMSALRMKVKNRSIIWMLRDGNPWDDSVIHTIVREELTSLAAELVSEAERLAELRPVAARRVGRSRHQSDYGQQDVSLLRQRENTNRAAAERILALGEDDAAVASIANGVRHDTLLEIVSSRPLPFVPHADDSVDLEHERRAIASITAELQTMLDRAEGREPAPRSVARPRPEPTIPWWRRRRR